MERIFTELDNRLRAYGLTHNLGQPFDRSDQWKPIAPSRENLPKLFERLEHTRNGGAHWEMDAARHCEMLARQLRDWLAANPAEVST